MKKSLFAAALAIVALAGVSCSRISGAGEVKMTDSVDSLSCALGYLEGKEFQKVVNNYTPFDTLDFERTAGLFADVTLKDAYADQRISQFGDFNAEVFKDAYINQLVYGKSYFDESSADAYLNKLFKAHQEVKKEQAKQEAVKAKSEGDAFLAENAKRPEVTVLESGLQYEILKEGNGPKPTADSRIKCDYHGTLINGEVFDSSVDRGKPATFGVSQVIKGWTEALLLMPVGSKWKLYVPADLAYGDKGAGEKIGPGSTLIFEIELLEIVNKEKKERKEKK
jgi:FKBP-type peptidyl-prolyl cis-trans isomerase FklB